MTPANQTQPYNGGDSGTQCATQYNTIQALCLKHNTLWQDPDFRAEQASVFYHQTPPFAFQWKRPKELCPHPTFVSDKQTRFDIIPGKMGDRWLVTCLSILYQSKGLFYRVVPADQTFAEANEPNGAVQQKANAEAVCGGGYAGLFRFRLWWCGQWTEVLVDDRLPTINGKLAFLQCAESDQFWPGLLEKAYAKLHGSYEALKYGTLLDGLSDLTGGITESMILNTNNNAAQCLKSLARLLTMTSLVTCTHTLIQQQQIRNHVEKLSNGIQIGTNYRICSLEKIDIFTGEQVYLLRLKDPLGTTVSDYNGPWARKNPEWDTIARDVKDRLIAQLETGEFWTSLDEFHGSFTHLEAVHLDAETSRDEPSLSAERAADGMESTRKGWQMRLYRGAWRRGVSAGGCRNNTDTFHINPQLQISLSDRDEVVMSLNQHSVAEPRVIGFTVYESRVIVQHSQQNNTHQSDANNKDNGSIGSSNSIVYAPGTLLESAPRSYFRRHKSLLNSQYTNSRQVSMRCSLDAGAYLILPTTFEPGQESDFTLRVYSSRPLKLRALDIAPCRLKSIIVKAPVFNNITNSAGAMPNNTATSNLTCGFGQYEAVFLQLADEHKTINAFELQELLEACLPNDYIKSCANMDVCRQIVMIMDKSGGGRIKFSDFKDLMCSLKHWQAAFRAHSKEKAGVLRAERFRDALHEAGFRLNTEALQALVLRYMRKDGTMRFGDYVSALLHLARAFGLFENKDVLQNGTIKMGLPDWLKSALTC